MKAIYLKIHIPLETLRNYRAYEYFTCLYSLPLRYLYLLPPSQHAARFYHRERAPMSVAVNLCVQSPHSRFMKTLLTFSVQPDKNHSGTKPTVHEIAIFYTDHD